MRECARCGRCYDDPVVVCPDDGSATVAALSGPAMLSDRYRLLRLLGHSSSAKVYLARDEILAEREVAIRLFEPGSMPEQAWVQLARQLASVQSENVVEVTDFGAGPERSFFLVMDRMSCGTLYEVVQRSGKMAAPRALTLLRQVAAGVLAIQERGLVHGALNPRNAFLEIRVTTLGGFTQEEIVKVSDFGWWQLRTLNAAALHSRAQPDAGTIEFLAPEQLQPVSAVGFQADVYGLGALAYYLLSGQPPFTGEMMTSMAQKAMDAPRPLNDLCPELSPGISTVVMNALLREAFARTDSVGEFITELESAVESAVRASGTDPPPRVTVEAPEGSTIYLDDEAQGDVGVGGTFSLLLVQPGVHMIRARYPDGAEDERLLEVPANANGQVLRVRLSPVDVTPAVTGGQRVSAAGIQSDGPESNRVALSVRSRPHELERNMPNDDIGTAPAAPGGAEATDQTRVDCPKCGESNRATSKFCRICGGPIKPKPVVEPAAPAPPPPLPEPEPAIEIASPSVVELAVDAPPPPAPAPPPPPVIESAPFPDPSSEIERARRELAAEEERLRALSESHRQQAVASASVPDDEQEEFETVFQQHISIPEVEEVPRNQAPTEELEREPPAVAVSPALVPAPNPLPDTMGGAGGLQVEIPQSDVYRSPGRPKTMESTGGSFDSQLSDAAKGNVAQPVGGLERSQTYYLGMGAILGLIILAIVGLVAFVVYWFVLSK